MSEDFKRDLAIIASEAPSVEQKKFIESSGPPAVPRFPEGRLNLKTHKPGITQQVYPRGQ